jgi:hypothetical protein
VATAYDNESELLAKYPHASANIRGLHVTQAQIHLSVDATALESQKWIRGAEFDRIVFNFPHLGGATDEDIEKNQKLLFSFFQSARPFLVYSSYITFCTFRAYEIRDHDVVNTTYVLIEYMLFHTIRVVPKVKFTLRCDKRPFTIAGTLWRKLRKPGTS